MPGRSTRRIRAEDLYRFRLVGGCELSPDGGHVVYSLQRVDKKSEKKYSNLWVVPVSKGPRVNSPLEIKMIASQSGLRTVDGSLFCQTGTMRSRHRFT